MNFKTNVSLIKYIFKNYGFVILKFYILFGIMKYFIPVIMKFKKMQKC